MSELFDWKIDAWNLKNLFREKKLDKFSDWFDWPTVEESIRLDVSSIVEKIDEMFEMEEQSVSTLHKHLWSKQQRRPY